MDLTASVTALTTFAFKRLGGIAEVDLADETASSTDNDLLDIQVQMKKVSLLRLLASQIIVGTGAGNNIEGFNALIDPAQDILLGVAPTLADFHNLISLVRASDGSLGAGADALVMNRNARRTLLGLIEAAGGGSACWAMNNTLGVPVLHFDGLPVYISDSIPLTGGPPANQTNIFAVKLTGPTGIRILHAGGNSDEFGIIVEDLPNQLAAGTRARAVRGFYTVLLPEVQSIARINNAVVVIP